MRSISGMPFDKLAGVAGRRVPLPNRRRANAKHFWNALRQTETLCVKVPGLFLATFD